MSYVSQLIRMDAFVARLRKIEREADPRPARETGASTCQRSGVCCWRRPCDLHPGGDVQRLAAHLGLSPERLFADHLVVDRGRRGGFRLRPRRGQQEGGRFLTAAQTFDVDAPCAFLKDGGCSVHEAKPTGGARWGCWMTEEETAALPNPAWSREELVALGWDGFEDDDDDW